MESSQNLSKHNELIPINPEDLNLPHPIERISSHTGAKQEIVDIGHSFYKKEEGSSGFEYHIPHDEIVLPPGEHIEPPKTKREDSLHEHTGVVKEKTHPEGHPGYTKVVKENTEIALLPGDELGLPPPIERISSHTGVVRELSHREHDQFYVPGDEKEKSFEPISGRDLIPMSPKELNLPPTLERISSHSGVKKEIFRQKEVCDPQISPPDVIEKERHGMKESQGGNKDNLETEQIEDVGEWKLPPGTKKRQLKHVVIKEEAGISKKVEQIEKKPEKQAELPTEWVEVKSGKGFKESPKKNILSGKSNV